MKNNRKDITWTRKRVQISGYSYHVPEQLNIKKKVKAKLVCSHATMCSGFGNNLGNKTRKKEKRKDEVIAQ